MDTPFHPVHGHLISPHPWTPHFTPCPWTVFDYFFLRLGLQPRAKTREPLVGHRDPVAESSLRSSRYSRRPSRSLFVLRSISALNRLRFVVGRNVVVICVVLIFDTQYVTAQISALLRLRSVVA